MSYLSCIDESLSSPWLCQQALTDSLVISISELRGNQQLARQLEQSWLAVTGIHRANACSSSGTLRLSYDLRHFGRKQLIARAGSPAGPA